MKNPSKIRVLILGGVSFCLVHCLHEYWGTGQAAVGVAARPDAICIWKAPSSSQLFCAWNAEDGLYTNDPLQHSPFIMMN